MNPELANQNIQQAAPGMRRGQQTDTNPGRRWRLSERLPAPNTEDVLAETPVASQMVGLLLTGRTQHIYAIDGDL